MLSNAKQYRFSKETYLGETYIAADGPSNIKIKTNAKKGGSIIVESVTIY